MKSSPTPSFTTRFPLALVLALIVVVAFLTYCAHIPIAFMPGKTAAVSSEQIEGEQRKSATGLRLKQKGESSPKKNPKVTAKKTRRLIKRAKRAVSTSAISSRRRVSLSAPQRRENIEGDSVPVTLFLEDVPTNVAMRALADLVGANIVLGGKVVGKRISLRLVHVPWHDALSSMARMSNLHAWENGGVIHVAASVKNVNLSAVTMFTLPKSGEVRAELFRLKHSDPKLMLQTLNSLFGSKKENSLQLAADPQTRSLLVQGKAKDLDVVAAIIKETDVPAKQIFIEAYIVEAGRDFEYILGSRLGYKRTGGSGNFDIAGVAGRAGDGSSSLKLGDDRNLLVNANVPSPIWGIGLLLDRRRLQIELTALERTGNSKIISSPKIYTLDNTEAMIFQGDEVPYSTVSDYGTKTEFKQAGIRLSVTPSIIDDDKMILDVAVSKDTVDKRVSNPPISRREMRTRLLAKNNSVVIIGGIFFNAETDTKASVPFLGDIPLIGRLFRRTSHEKDSRELLVFISPSIVS